MENVQNSCCKKEKLISVFSIGELGYSDESFWWKQLKFLETVLKKRKKENLEQLQSWKDSGELPGQIVGINNNPNK